MSGIVGKEGRRAWDDILLCVFVGGEEGRKDSGAWGLS